MEYAFMQRALIMALAVGVVAGVVGSFVILRGLSLMGDAISHAVLPGVAMSYAVGINLIFGAMTMGLATAVAITYIQRRSHLKSDTAMGVVFSAAFALGVILIAEVDAAVNLHNILFGNLLAVTKADFILTLVIAGLVLGVMELFYRHLLLTTFDPQVAPTYGSSPPAMHYLLMVVLTAVTVAALQTVGIILVVAMLVTPAASAFLVTQRMRPLMTVAVVVAVVSAVCGMYLSYAFNLPSGPAIVLVLATIFTVLWVAARVKRRLQSRKSIEVVAGR
ncbi:MAG TPA: metal ABC transporter permease [Beutenbergiaceae bacterium]|nr:metal ABC transporter permease [Beutenbergiaceae bacterium]